jgi:hypothetical protein
MTRIRRYGARGLAKLDVIFDNALLLTLHKDRLSPSPDFREISQNF